MQVSVKNKIECYQIYSEITLLFIFLHQPSILRSLQPQAHWYFEDGGIWSDGGLFDKIKLIIIAITIDLTFIGLIDSQGNSFHS